MTLTYTKITPGPLTPESIIESTEVVAPIVKQFTFGSLDTEKQQLIQAKTANLNSVAIVTARDVEFDTKIAEKDDLIDLIENLP